MRDTAIDERGIVVTADEAAGTHKPGDRYFTPFKPDVTLRLHIRRVPHGPRNHFEIEPRWTYRRQGAA